MKWHRSEVIPSLALYTQPLVSIETVYGVRGDLIRWARTEQSLTMRVIHDRGGPSPGYQSEVENGAKSEVRSTLLARWAKALDVTEGFIRGSLPVYREHPAECRGLAGHVAARIAAGGPDLPDWASLAPLERARQVLQLVTRESPILPRVVAAHVLGLSLDAFDRIAAGELPMVKDLAAAVADLTALPTPFFRFGRLTYPSDELDWPQYADAVREVVAAGISPEELRAWARSYRHR